MNLANLQSAKIIHRFAMILLMFMLPYAVWAGPNNTGESERILYILDASGSMWGQIDGKPKMDIAKQALTQLISQQPENMAIGIMAYGHRRKADCNDIEIISPVQSGTAARQQQLSLIDQIKPKGKTPLAQSVAQAIDVMAKLPGQSTVILISDGKESCHLDPCAAVEAANKKDVQFVLHTIGFSVDKEAASQLSCMAQAGHGRYFQAENAEQLTESASQATQLGAGANLTVEATNNGAPIKVRIFMHPTDSKNAVILTGDDGVDSGAKYKVAAGDYLLEVSPANAAGNTPQTRKITIESGMNKTEVFDFGLNEWSFSATDNGNQSRFKLGVVSTQNNTPVFDTNTFSTFTMNGVDSPYALKLNSGVYKLIAHLADNTIGSIEKELNTSSSVNNNIVFDFKTGKINIDVKKDGQSVVANVLVYAEDSKTPLYSSMPYVGQQTPVKLKLFPGQYRIQGWPVGQDIAGDNATKLITLEQADSQNILFSFGDNNSQSNNTEDSDTSNAAFEMNTDRPGLDYKNFGLPNSDPKLCYQACQADVNCKSWTYIKPNTVQGPTPVCWLKNAIPAANKNDCCVSGVIER